jgi:uncharacterized protein (TIGR02444 family)
MNGADADWPESAFWTFSLDLYSQPEVEAACLTLQDDHGLDVNLVLLAAWLARTARHVAPGVAKRLRTLADEYQAEVMQPVRQARRALKRQMTRLPLAPLLAQRRSDLMAVELDLERVEQLMLEALAAVLPSDASRPATLFARNLASLYPDRPVPTELLAPLVDRLSRLDASTNKTAEQAVKGIT